MHVHAWRRVAPRAKRRALGWVGYGGGGGDLARSAGWSARRTCRLVDAARHFPDSLAFTVMHPPAWPGVGRGGLLFHAGRLAGRRLCWRGAWLGTGQEPGVVKCGAPEGVGGLQRSPRVRSRVHSCLGPPLCRSSPGANCHTGCHTARAMKGPPLPGLASGLFQGDAGISSVTLNTC